MHPPSIPPVGQMKMMTLNELVIISALPPDEDGLKHQSKQPKLQVDFEIFYKISKCMRNYNSLSIEIFNK